MVLAAVTTDPPVDCEKNRTLPELPASNEYEVLNVSALAPPACRVIKAAPPPVTAIGLAGVPASVRPLEFEMVIDPPLAVERMVPLLVRAEVVMAMFCPVMSDEALSIKTALADRVAEPLMVGAKVLRVNVPLFARRVVLGAVRLPEPRTVRSVVPARVTALVPLMVPLLLMLGAVIVREPSLVIEPPAWTIRTGAVFVEVMVMLPLDGVELLVNCVVPPTIACSEVLDGVKEMETVLAEVKF